MTILNTLAPWALTSSLLILAVLLLRLLLREDLSARARYALWAVVLVRLLIPFQLSVPNLSLPDAAGLAPTFSDPLEDFQDTGIYAFPTGEVNPDLASSSGTDIVSYGITSRQILGLPVQYIDGCDVATEEGLVSYALYLPLSYLLLLLWAAGALAVGTALLVSNLRFSRRLRLDVPLHIGFPMKIYVVAGLPSPCLFGLRRPAIYLPPEIAGDETARAHVLAHEYTHYRHRDHIWSLLRCLCLVFHWYNPLVWAAALLSKRDGELACDEGAVARLGEAERIPYGRTLVSMVAQRSLRPADLLSCSTSMTGGARTIRRRVTQLIQHPRTKKAALTMAAVALICASLVVFVRGGGMPGRFSGMDYQDVLYELSDPSNRFLPSYVSLRSPHGNIKENPGFQSQLLDLLAQGTESRAEDSRHMYLDPDAYYAGDSIWFTSCYPGIYLSEQPDGCYLAIATAEDPCYRVAILPSGTVDRVAALVLRYLPGEPYISTSPFGMAAIRGLLAGDTAFLAENAARYNVEPAEIAGWLTQYQGVDPDALTVVYDTLEEVEGPGWTLNAWSGDTLLYALSIPDASVPAVAELCMTDDNWMTLATAQLDPSFPSPPWEDGVAFSLLGPGEEAVSAGTVEVPAQGGDVQLALTYARADLTLTVGLRGEDGMEVIWSVTGGTFHETASSLSAGSYRLFVRNSGDYTQFPSYQDGSVSYAATGCLNFRLIGEV